MVSLNVVLSAFRIMARRLRSETSKSRSCLTANAAPAAIYNAAGQRVSNMTKGLNIVKMNNGNVKKVLKK